MTLSAERLKELIEASRKKLAAPKPDATLVLVDETVMIPPALEAALTPIIGEVGTFEWNEQQLEAISRADKGESFNLIGAAGTGKTTTEREIATRSVASGRIPIIDIGTKYLCVGVPGIVFTSFTRRAVRNMRRVVSEELQKHCITLHKLLEYEPVFYEVYDAETQQMRKTMRFEPTRNEKNKLPYTLKTIVIDESSMVSTELFLQLLRALPDPSKVQFIFVGDLHQLPPVYGSAILGFKLLELPTVELTKIYRQAQKSPIITLAHKIKNGEDIPVKEKSVVETEQGKVTIHPWKKPLSDFDATHVMSTFLKNLVKEGHFDEEEDIILCPQEKTTNLAFGTNEFNKIVAQTLGEQRNPPAVVNEIVAGFIVHYFAIGDRLLVGREDAVITNITKNARYWGKRPRPASVELDRWGNYKKKIAEETNQEDDFDLDKYLESFTLEADKPGEERKQEASHVIEVELLDSGVIETLSTAGEINGAQFAYCLTVHKSQGSEWNRVFFLTHQSHVVMWSRELLYTAVTRARKELYCIVEPDRNTKPGTLTKAARSPRIKGDTLAEKAEFFKGKAEEFNKKVEAIGTLEHDYEVRGSASAHKEAPVVVPVAEKPKVTLVRLGEYVSAQFKHEAQEALDRCWARAELVWGAAKIGSKPKLNCDLQRARTIALAGLTDGTLYLNALWCIAADENEWIRKDMLEDSIPHEVAHFINHHYSTPAGKGHDGGWIMAAKLLGMKNPEATTSEYPDWAETYKEQALEILKKKAAALEGQNKTIDLNDDVIPLGAEA